MMSGMPTALVTGPTSGIGRAFARQLAARGYHLVLVARDVERLQALAAELRGTCGVDAEVIAADLAVAEQRAPVETRLAEGVDLLVHNAGFGTAGRFWRVPLGPEEQQAQMHVVATIRLAHAALAPMVARGSGAIVVVSSTAGLVPAASAPTYGATKAFQVFFTESLAVSLQGTGVRAMVLCPGFTRTEFHERGGMPTAQLPGFAWLTADRVVHEALRDLARGRIVSIPSRRYRWPVAVAGMVPRSLLRRAAARSVRGRRPGNAS